MDSPPADDRTTSRWLPVRFGGDGDGDPRRGDTGDTAATWPWATAEAPATLLLPPLRCSDDGDKGPAVSPPPPPMTLPSLSLILPMNDEVGRMYGRCSMGDVTVDDAPVVPTLLTREWAEAEREREPDAAVTAAVGSSA